MACLEQQGAFISRSVVLIRSAQLRADGLISLCRSQCRREGGLKRWDSRIELDLCVDFPGVEIERRREG